MKISKKDKVEKAIRKLKSLKGITLGNLSVRKMREKGRR